MKGRWSQKLSAYPYLRQPTTEELEERKAKEEEQERWDTYQRMATASARAKLRRMQRRGLVDRHGEPLT